ncbi:MAG: SusC/RagA family TonB-linked outer membrane protein [Ginsengibacter sp.]
MIFSLLKGKRGFFFLAGLFFCVNASAHEKDKLTSKLPSKVSSTYDAPHFKKEVRGTVSDSSGILANVSVYVKNQPNIGTATDQNGKYVLDVPDDNAILVFEMTGYETVELPVKGKTVINAFMKISHQGLDEVVVVAYGKQKKQSVVGSITTINPQELKIPSSNLTQALAGKLAGVIAYQRSGEPGADNAQFFIRGATTFGYKKDPLILIDGMEYSTTELARLNVDDIASFSIMKDATANALYGARGANGVILITTKEGKEGRAKIDIRYEKTMSEATRMVQLADPITYMKLENESVLTRNPLGILPYSQEKIDNTISGVNPDYYPTNDWQSMMFTPQTYNQRVNFNLAGGGKIATYYIASSMNQDNGNLKVDHRNNFNTNINLKTYTIRSNVNIKVTKSTTALVRLFGTFDGYTGPQTSGSAMYLNVMRTNPVMFKPYYAADSQHRFINHILFGNAEVGNYFNPYADMVKGYQQYSNSLMGAQAEVQQDLSGIITQGLSLRGMITTNRRANFSVNRAYIPFYYSTTSYDKISNTFRLNDLNADKGTDFIDFVPGSKSVLSTFHGELSTNYNRSFGKSGVTGMAIMMLQNDVSGNESTLQRSLPSRNITLGGRATYSYDNKYFIESNFAYNGSERFYKDQRFGFFPSVGVAWSVSNESFFDPLKDIFTKMRIRGNYGLVGNDAIGSASDRFFYLSNINMNDAAFGASFGTDGGYSRPGISVARYDNTAITWETARNSTFGLETTLFGKIDITAEYFTEERYNILMDRASIPNTMGLEGATPKANVGKSHSESVDISANYNQYFSKDFNISIMGNFTFARNKFKAYEEPQYKYPWSYRVGQPINQQWGYIAERLFVDEEEVRSSPTQVFGNTKTMAGDIKYRDVNGDGVVNQDDMVPIGFPTSPEIIYGFWFTSAYKNFDFSFGLQGSARSSFWIDPASTAPFISYRYTTGDPAPDGVLLNNQLLKAYADNHWSEDNRNLYALWPRLSHNLNSNNSQPNTWFMRNGAFLRVKQVQFGYALPAHTIKKIGMNRFRVYFTGSNLFTFSAFKLWDVEMGGDGLKYPIQKSFTIGIDAGF